MKDCHPQVVAASFNYGVSKILRVLCSSYGRREEAGKMELKKGVPLPTDSGKGSTGMAEAARILGKHEYYFCGRKFADKLEGIDK